MLNEVYKAKRGPKALIEHFFSKVSLFESFVVVFISFVINILLFLVLKIPNFISVSALFLYSTILINWLVLGVVLYFVTYFIRGAKKLPKNAFQKVLSALASFRIPAIIYFIIFAVLSLIFLNPLIPIFQAVSQNPELITSTTLFPALNAFNVFGLILIGLVSLFFLVYVIIMFYEFTEIVFDVKSPILKIALLVLIFAISMLLSSIFL